MKEGKRKQNRKDEKQVGRKDEKKAKVERGV